MYVRRPNQEERETGAEPLTQFGRMCATLGIKIIPASSPQAKGRIERNHGTHQDRLVKKLRRQRIADIEAANVFLDGYWAEHNRRFAQRPASADDFHVAVSRALRLDQVFRLEETRTVSNDWVVRYENRYLQIERQSHRPPARSSVTVYEASTGQLEIRYRDPRDAVDGNSGAGVQGRGTRRPGLAADGRAGAGPSSQRPTAGSPVAKFRHRAALRVSTVHPRPTGMGTRAAMKACGSCRTCGREEHGAHKSLENYRTVFHELPQAVFF